MIAVVWSRSYPKFHMALWASIALAWLMIGANSGRVPTGTTTTWLFMNAIVAGAALGVAYRSTASSVFWYLVAALIAGGARSLAYLMDGSPGPGTVWLLITLTNFALLGRWTESHAQQ